MERKKRKCVLALGYFDGVHIGHRSVVAAAKSLALQCGAQCGVFTFAGDIGGRFGKESGSIYTAQEREKLLMEDCGADFVFAAPCGEEFFRLTREEFLTYLESELEIVGYACGFDYTFGKNGAGNAAFLQAFAKEKNIAVSVAPPLFVGGEKVSATEIKRRLKAGDVAAANDLLTRPYFVTGTAVKERGVGRRMGFPTVNLYPAAEKLPLKNAVYGGHAEIDGKTYKAIVNYGARPTFGLSTPLVEAHLIGFDGDLYGREIEISFDGFLREICRFSGEEELKAQLERDKREVLQR
ncbi:MAG: riboflavin biosynthesis protein RibF [Bacillota bacterium]|nr:MAG: riboflavin biosynthesis protein RibF [Bacillota bacterium]